MAIAKMKLVGVAGVVEQLNEFIESCCMDGDFHPEQAIQYLPDDLGYASMEDVNPYADMLQKVEEFAHNAKFDIAPVRHLKHTPTDEEIRAFVDRINSDVGETAAGRKDLIEQRQACERGIEQLKHFTNFDTDLDEVFNCQYIKVRFGHLPKDSYEKLLNMQEDNPYIFFVPCSVDAFDYWGMYFAPREKIAEVDQVFQNLYFNRLHIPGAAGTAREGLEQLQKNNELLEEILEKINGQLDEYWEENRERFIEVYTRLTYLKAVYDLRKYAAVKGRYFFFAGWVPAKRARIFEARAKKIRRSAYEISDPDPKSPSKPPVLLKNNPLFEPFEFYIEMYGLPSYDEFDATGLVAVTYTILFGIMFGDVGQGIVLAILGYLMWKIKKMALGKILVPCGIAATIGGFVYGSVFGSETLLDPLYAALGMSGKPVEVMDSVIGLLIFSIGIGVVLVIVAMLMNVFVSLKRKQFGRAVFHHNGVMGVLLYASLVTLVVQLFTGTSVVPTAALIAIIIAAVVLLFFEGLLVNLIDDRQHWKPESWGDYILENLFELLDYFISYMSNTISFLRVGAFVLVHAAMMTVVFAIAQGNIIVIVLGNILVMALEGLLTGIQALRLEFYEMFSRFYEGEGRPFEGVKIAYQERAEKRRNKKLRKTQKLEELK